MTKIKTIKGDPFWEENSKLSVSQIEEGFPTKTAESLKILKTIRESIEN